MADGSPESDTWLQALIQRSPLLPERTLRRHWQRLVPWLPTSARYELAAILVELEHSARRPRA